MADKRKKDPEVDPRGVDDGVLGDTEKWQKEKKASKP